MKDFSIRMDHKATMPEAVMRDLLNTAGWSKKKIKKTMKLSDKDLEWKILSDPEVVRALELSLVLAQVSLRIQLCVESTEPDEELHPEAVEVAREEAEDAEAKAGSPT